MSDNVILLHGEHTCACEPSAVPRMLRELADEWETNPPGEGVLVVIPARNGYPDVRGFGRCGEPIIELELARMQLYKLYLGDER